MSFETIVGVHDVAEHLNIENGTDYDLLEQKIAVAENWIGKFIGIPLDDAETFPDGLPEPLKEAVRQLVGHLYENREATIIAASAELMPLGLYDLMAPYRRWTF